MAKQEKMFEFEVGLSVADYKGKDEQFPPKYSDAADVLFAMCQSDIESARKVAVTELLEAGVSQETVNRLQPDMTVEFAEFDSPNPTHAGGMFTVRLSGDKADVDETERKWTAWMNR